MAGPRPRKKAARSAPSLSPGSTSGRRGELMTHFMLATIVAAHLLVLGVDPFDPPAVEEGKVLAKNYLAGKA